MCHNGQTSAAEVDASWSSRTLIQSYAQSNPNLPTFDNLAHLSTLNLWDIVTILRITWDWHEARLSDVAFWWRGAWGHSPDRGPAPTDSLTYPQTPRHQFLCVPQKCNAEHVAKLFFWKSNTIFSSSNFLLRWGRVVFFLWKVISLIKASWKYSTSEMQVGWFKEKKRALRRAESGKNGSDQCFSRFLWPTARRTISVTMQYCLRYLMSSTYLVLCLKMSLTYSTTFEML